jgi:hypothetical protein
MDSIDDMIEAVFRAKRQKHEDHIERFRRLFQPAEDEIMDKVRAWLSVSVQNGTTERRDITVSLKSEEIASYPDLDGEWRIFMQRIRERLRGKRRSLSVSLPGYHVLGSELTLMMSVEFPKEE